MRGAEAAGKGWEARELPEGGSGAVRRVSPHVLHAVLAERLVLVLNSFTPGPSKVVVGFLRGLPLGEARPSAPAALARLSPANLGGSCGQRAGRLFPAFLRGESGMGFSRVFSDSAVPPGTPCWPRCASGACGPGLLRRFGFGSASPRIHFHGLKSHADNTIHICNVVVKGLQMESREKKTGSKSS